MKLLCLKSQGQYLRVLKDGYELTQINKASVYPDADLELVRQICADFEDQIAFLKIVEITLIEKELVL